MFSGKTEELIRRLKRAKFAKQRVEIYKPAIDTRYSEADVVSHDSHTISSTPIDSSASILLFTSEIDVVGIDEAQFFDEGLIDVCNQLANNGIRVIVAGLDMDFRGNRDQNKLNVARRTCGYIGTQFWNQGRTQEIKDRVLHL